MHLSLRMLFGVYSVDSFDTKSFTKDLCFCTNKLACVAGGFVDNGNPGVEGGVEGQSQKPLILKQKNTMRILFCENHSKIISNGL